MRKRRSEMKKLSMAVLAFAASTIFAVGAYAGGQSHGTHSGDYGAYSGSGFDSGISGKDEGLTSRDDSLTDQSFSDRDESMAEGLQDDTARSEGVSPDWNKGSEMSKDFSSKGSHDDTYTSEGVSPSFKGEGDFSAKGPSADLDKDKGHVSGGMSEESDRTYRWGMRSDSDTLKSEGLSPSWRDKDDSMSQGSDLEGHAYGDLNTDQDLTSREDFSSDFSSNDRAQGVSPSWEDKDDSMSKDLSRDEDHVYGGDMDQDLSADQDFSQDRTEGVSPEWGTDADLRSGDDIRGQSSDMSGFDYESYAQ
jgi:hypothetical protein